MFLTLHTVTDHTGSHTALFLRCLNTFLFIFLSNTMESFFKKWRRNFHNNERLHNCQHKSNIIRFRITFIKSSYYEFYSKNQMKQRILLRSNFVSLSHLFSTFIRFSYFCYRSIHSLFIFYSLYPLNSVFVRFFTFVIRFPVFIRFELFIRSLTFSDLSPSLYIFSTNFFFYLSSFWLHLTS